MRNGTQGVRQSVNDTGDIVVQDNVPAPSGDDEDEDDDEDDEDEDDEDD